MKLLLRPQDIRLNYIKIILAIFIRCTSSSYGSQYISMQLYSALLVYHVLIAYLWNFDTFLYSFMTTTKRSLLQAYYQTTNKLGLRLYPNL